MTAPATDRPPLSAECTLAARPGYNDVHEQCRQTKDVPLPHGDGILLARRCGCLCHAEIRAHLEAGCALLNDSGVTGSFRG